VKALRERPTRGRVTIDDVAELAGVSAATVSRVVNGHPDVSPGTRAEVLRLAQELGYVTNRGASAETAQKRPQLVALATSSIYGEHMTEIVAGAADALRDRNVHLVICSLDVDSSQSLRDGLLQGTTGGALLVSPPHTSAELHGLRRTGYPFVVIEPTMPVDEGIPAVTVSNWAGAKAATEHLIGLGHIHIGVITGPRQWRTQADRLAGYQAALLGAGLPLAPKLVHEAGFSLAGGREAGEALLALPNPPSAIVAMDDTLAVGVLQAAHQRKMQVPRDVSVSGFGDTQMASVTQPPLTTVQQPLQGLGRVAAGMLWRLLQGQQLDAPRMELATTLVVRESTGRPRGTSFLTM